MNIRKSMKVRKTLAALSLVAVLSTTAACAAESSTTTSTSTSQSATTTGDTANAAGQGGGGPGGVDVSSVTTEAQLIAMIQEAYGDASLDLHRGHQPVQDVLDEVLSISHEELHVRMEEQGQNLATVADDLGVGQQTLIDALVASWRPAIDTLLENGTITQAQADAYLEALKEAFTFRVTWDGTAETPTFSGLDA
jgi:polyhydroxyalkanoate synthesis regulator phasin